MSDATHTWKLIHAERAAMADTLSGLTEDQWQQPSLCGDWSVRTTAGHILAGAEQTTGRFLGHMVQNGFRFNRMIDRDARATATLSPDQIVKRLRATTTATNHPPAPITTMLGEVIVHGEDIRHPLGIKVDHDPEALTACFEMYKTSSFPVGSKQRIAGLRLAPDDVDWTHGDGPEVTGPSNAMLLVMTGRAGALSDLSGEGVGTLRSRMGATA